MAHTPFGYQIVGGKVFVNEQEAERLKTLFKAYLSGKSMQNAGKKANINRTHSGITRLLTDERYLGNEIFPALISKEVFECAQEERHKRAKKLGRLNRKKKEERFQPSYEFLINEIEKEYDNPIKQAEYVYSLIQSEVT
ncbi:recombinase [Siminovitchia sp. FSL H7-0308]|uniref:recombinase n=1 Tax=Siminovitchia sp. FSL H7-0308 TaxID=2921432 RepID=UPI0030ED82EC